MTPKVAPFSLRLTGGQIADCAEAQALTDELGKGDILLADKCDDVVLGYDIFAGAGCFLSAFHGRSKAGAAAITKRLARFAYR